MDSCMIHCMNVHLSEKILLLNNFGLAQWFDLNLLQSSQSHVSRKQSFSVVAPPQLIEFSADGFWASPIFLSLRARLSQVALWTRVQFGLTKVWMEWVTSELPFASVPKRVFARNHSYGHIYIVFRLHVHFHVNQTHVHMKGFAWRLVLKQAHGIFCLNEASSTF